MAFLAVGGGKSGSERIATELFLTRLGEHLQTFLTAETTIVDYGAGIGTVSAFVRYLGLRNHVIAVEPLKIFRSYYMKNLNIQKDSRIRLIEVLEDNEELPTGSFWIIDKSFERKDLVKIIDSAPQILMVEGHRHSQTAKILLLSARNGTFFKIDKFGSWLSPRGKGGVALVPDSQARADLLWNFPLFFLASGYHRLQSVLVKTLNGLGIGIGSS